MTAKSYKSAWARHMLSSAVLLGSLVTVPVSAQQIFVASNADELPSTVLARFLAKAQDIQTIDFDLAVVGKPPRYFSSTNTGGLDLLGNTAKLSQSVDALGTIIQGSENNGRFNTSPACLPPLPQICKWWETSETFDLRLTFESSALGFYLSDAADVGGSIKLDLWKNGQQVRSGIDVSTANQTTGLMFFGWVDDQFTFDRVTFNVLQSNPNPNLSDVMGFDDVIVANRLVSASTPVSAPASMALVLLGLGLMAATRRRAV